MHYRRSRLATIILGSKSQGRNLDITLKYFTFVVLLAKHSKHTYTTLQLIQTIVEHKDGGKSKSHAISQTAYGRGNDSLCHVRDGIWCEGVEEEDLKSSILNCRMFGFKYGRPGRVGPLFFCASQRRHV